MTGTLGGAKSSTCATPSVSSAGAPSGSTSSSSSASVERCVVGSNRRIDSTSSPKNSRRTGRAWLGTNTSTMPPRTLHCPTSTTVSTRSYPAASNASSSSSRSSRSPVAIRSERSANSRGAGSGVSSPAGVATTTTGSPAASRRAITARSASASR
jgi:hypothetical protein